MRVMGRWKGLYGGWRGLRGSEEKQVKALRRRYYCERVWVLRAMNAWCLEFLERLAMDG